MRQGSRKKALDLGYRPPPRLATRGYSIGAKSAMEIQKLAGLSTEAFEDQSGDEFFREAIGKAVRGDKEAAYVLAQLFRNGRADIAPNSRRMEQWLRFSAELGNGRASWELAEHYNYVGLIADAAHFERRAIEQGYQPAVRLPSRGY
jgi:TPR repeat protein